MAILNLVGAKVWGGGEQYVYDICEEFSERNIESIVLTEESVPDIGKRYEAVAKVVEGRLHGIAFPTDFFRMVGELRDVGVTDIFCHSGRTIAAGLLLKYLLGANLIFFKHNVICRKTDIYHKWLESCTDAFICVSKLVYDMQTEGIIAKKARDKYYLVHNGVNPRRFISEVREKKREGRFVIGFAGRLHANKGIFELLEAMKPLHERYPNIVAELWGEGDEEDVRAICAYLETNDMNGYVRLCGFSRDMAAVYARFDAAVFPSKVREAFGLAVCEAMYCGVPVVTSASGAQIEMAEHLRNAFILPGVSSVAIADAIVFFRENETERKRIAACGRESVRERFTIGRTVDGILAVTEALHDGKHEGVVR